MSALHLCGSCWKGTTSCASWSVTATGSSVHDWRACPRRDITLSRQFLSGCRCPSGRSRRRVGTPRRRLKTKAGSCELAGFENVVPFRKTFPSGACSSRAFCRRAALEVVKLGDFFAHSWDRIFAGSPGDVSEVARTRESARSNGILACQRF